MYARILVPLDGSPTAERGLQEALQLARTLSSTLVLLHVIDEYPLLVDMAAAMSFDAAREGLLQNAAQLLERARAMAEGVPVETLVRESTMGRVADLIVAEAATQRCELIVMGTHGRRGLTRLALGSDAELVLRGASVPVLLVRQQAPQD